MPVRFDFIAPKSSVSVSKANRSCRLSSLRKALKSASVATSL